MKARWAAIIGIVLLASQASAGEKTRPLDTQKKKVSYAMGVAVAKNIQRQGVEIDLHDFARGLEDALSGGRLLMTEDEQRETMGPVLAEVKRKQAEAEKEAQQKRSSAGEAFLAENARKEGVVSLPSGLQYQILEARDGSKPTDADTVECHYRGTFIDGKEFDSSYGRGRSATLKLTRVIPGFREALKLMPVGSRWRIFVPPKLGYGARGGRGKNKVGPNETLVYEVHLLAIQPPIAPASASDKTAAAPAPGETMKTSGSR